MSGQNKSRKWKLAVKIALGCVLAIDAALVAVNWHAAAENPQAQAEESARLAQKVKLLAADVQKGRAIENRLPNVSQEGERFYREDLLPSSSGDTTVIADIEQLAKAASVQTSGLTLSEKDVKEHGIKEVKISGAVQGDYQSLIQLISGIERSPHFYVLDGLTLSSEKSGVIRLQVSLRTYFRT